MSTKKKLSEYLSKSVRKIRHRKGYGVHSPFAYSIITEVIEEKVPYYAYHRMQRTYTGKVPIAHKVACLLLRLANRFRCRNVAEICCDGGYSILPLILTDSRLQVASLATPEAKAQSLDLLSWLPSHMPQITFHEEISTMDAAAPYDMIVINGNPFEPQDVRPNPGQQEEAAALLEAWVMSHVKDDTLIFVKGIQIGHRQERFWDLVCDRDDVSVTMDLYDYGLAILHPHFYKQHYVVAF